MRAFVRHLVLPIAAGIAVATCEPPYYHYATDAEPIALALAPSEPVVLHASLALTWPDDADLEALYIADVVVVISVDEPDDTSYVPSGRRDTGVSGARMVHFGLWDDQGNATYNELDGGSANGGLQIDFCHGDDACSQTWESACDTSVGTACVVAYTLAVWTDGEVIQPVTVDLHAQFLSRGEDVPVDLNLETDWE